MVLAAGAALMLLPACVQSVPARAAAKPVRTAPRTPATPVAAAAAMHPLVAAVAPISPAHPAVFNPAPDGSATRVARYVSPVRPPGAPTKVVALTFDDGPSPYSLQVLAILKRKHVRATFFELGNQARAYPNITTTLARAGMSVQNHTWDHKGLPALPGSAVRAEITRAERTLTALTGKKPTCLRPPYGAHNATTLAGAASTGYQLVNWDVDPRDWSRPGAAAIKARVLAATTNNSIVLLHDGGGPRSQTVAALPGIIDALAGRGYTFVTLCQR